MSSSYNDYLAYYGFHAALLLAALWILQRTTYWRRRTGTVREWQFSMAEALVITTIVAALAVVARSSPFFGEFKWHTIATAFCFVTLSLASILLWSQSLHWLMKLAEVLGVAVLLGVILGLTTHVAFTNASYLIQGGVLAIWLVVDAERIIPAPQTSVVSAGETGSN
jgi:hypothetical protein